MAIGNMIFHSEELNRNVDFRFLLPEGPSLYEEDKSYFDRAPRVLYLLHGHGNGNEEWLTGSSIKDFSYRYNMAVIMPGGGNSFYLNHPEARSIPIIALTANAYQEDMEACMAAGMNEHLAKPIRIEEVVQVLAKYL